MKVAALLLPLVLLSTPLRAEEKAPAERLLEAMDFDAVSMAGAKASFAPAIEQFKKQGIPPEGIKEITAAADKFFTDTFGDPGLRAAIIKLYGEKFTPAEIEDLIKFYKTPTGKKSITAMPELITQAGEVGQEFAQKRAPGFQKEIQAILAKYKPDAPATGDFEEPEEPKAKKGE